MLTFQLKLETNQSVDIWWWWWSNSVTWSPYSPMINHHLSRTNTGYTQPPPIDTWLTFSTVVAIKSHGRGQVRSVRKYQQLTPYSYNILTNCLSLVQADLSLHFSNWYKDIPVVVIEVEWSCLFVLQMDSQLLIMLVLSPILFLSAQSPGMSRCSF